MLVIPDFFTVNLATIAVLVRVAALTVIGFSLFRQQGEKKKSLVLYGTFYLLFITNQLMTYSRDYTYFGYEVLFLVFSLAVFFTGIRLWGFNAFVLASLLGNNLLWGDMASLYGELLLLIPTFLLAFITSLNRKDYERNMQALLQESEDQNKELLNRSEYENIISEISASVIYLPASELDWTIDLILETVGVFEKVDRCYVTSYQEQSDNLDFLYTWSADGSGSFHQEWSSFQLEQLPYINEQIQNGQMILANNPAEFPLPLRKELNTFTGYRVNSVLMAPLFYSNKIAGFFGFDSAESRPEGWSDRTMNLINIIGQVIMTALERKRSFNVIQMNDEKFSELSKSLKQVFFLTNRDLSEFIYVSPPFEDIWEEPVDTLYLNPHFWREKILPAHKEQLEYVLKNHVLNGESFDIEFQISLESNSVKWVRMSAFPVLDDVENVYRYSGVMEDITEAKGVEIRLAEARSYEADVSSRVQQTLLLTTLDEPMKGLDLDVMSIPSQSVDGDFFDFYPLSSTILDFVLADVMGKGIAAALMGAAAKNSFNRSRLDLTLSKSRIPSPQEIVAQTDAYVSSDMINLGKFLTLYYGRIHLKKRYFDFVDCGHTSIIHYCPKSQSCWTIKGVNMPMGFVAGQNYKQFRLPLFPGDLFFLYSDGITEATNSEGELFGEERLVHVIRSCHQLPATEIANRVKDITFNYSAEGFNDDVSCIAFKPTWTEDSPQYFNMDYPRQEDSIRLIRGDFESQLGDHMSTSFNSEEKAALVLAVNEAAANIMEHSSQDDQEVGIQVELGIERGWFFVRFTYAGEEFNWHDIPTPDITTYQDSGYGLHLIQSIMDSALFYKGENGLYRICLAKTFTQ